MRVQIPPPARVWIPESTDPIPINEIVVIGRRLRRIAVGVGNDDPLSEQDRAVYDRQVLALGSPGQNLAQRSRVAIVGVGGTGSSVAEQLVRLGARDLLLVEPQRYEQTNHTRMYGTSAVPVLWRRFTRRQPPYKVHLLAAHLRRIQPKVAIATVPKNIVLHDVARALRDRDVIFLCTDDHWGRAIVNELAYQYLIPTINLGARIAAQDGRITAAVGVVDILRPGLPCLWCKQYLQADRIAAESMPRSLRKVLAREGYVEGLDANTPAVISLTTTVAGLSTTCYLQLLTDFMGVVPSAVESRRRSGLTIYAI